MSDQTNNYNVNPIQLTTNQDTPQARYFNNFFTEAFQVSPNVDAAVLSYFEAVTENRESAKILASAVIYTSYTRGVDPMSILTEFTRLPPGEINSYLTMFLNLQRVGTSYLGLTAKPVANKYVSRAVLP